jgi:hypothetical protein
MSLNFATALLRSSGGSPPSTSQTFLYIVRHFEKPQDSCLDFGRSNRYTGEMKTILLLLLLGASSCFASETQTNITNSVGRYQMKFGSLKQVTDAGMLDVHAVFRVDTKTGRCWRLYSSAGAAGLIDEWREIREPSLPQFAPGGPFLSSTNQPSSSP